ncbi:MAG: DUF4831 family protein [Bacteroidota bacterium]|nr:DUF4831 family protein [Bacteroidota bacterium]
MKQSFLTITCLLASLSAFSQIQVTPLKDATKPLDGIVYTLPKNVLEIEVELKKTVEAPGPYVQYAERFLGLTNMIKADQTSWQLVNIRVHPKAVPDSQNSYLATINAKDKRTASASLTPDGFLISFNSKKSTVKPLSPIIDSKQTPAAKPYESMESSLVTREMQQATSTAKSAELAANQLFSLREARLSLLGQEIEHVPSDGRSYEVVLGELNRMERYYTELFAGKRTVTTEVKQFEFDPKKDEEIILFRFNQQLGLVDKSDLSGSPVTLKVAKKPGLIVESLRADKEKEKKQGSIGLYYRMPGTGIFTISDGTTVYFNDSFPIAQFGTVETLPAKDVWQVELSTETGALLKLGE